MNTDPNFGVVTLTIPQAQWDALPPQGKLLAVVHHLIDFASNPVFHSVDFKAIRIDVKSHPQQLVPAVVVAHIGNLGGLKEVLGNG